MAHALAPGLARAREKVDPPWVATTTSSLDESELDEDSSPEHPNTIKVTSKRITAFVNFIN